MLHITGFWSNSGAYYILVKNDVLVMLGNIFLMQILVLIDFSWIRKRLVYLNLIYVQALLYLQLNYKGAQLCG
jgi:hypothetical protein